jgi:hypothetical protein
MENPISPPEQLFRIAVTEADFDDMGQILKGMGYDFRVYNIQELGAPEVMKNVDILFINCKGPEPTWEAANRIREMVSSGGAIYVSCYAEKWLQFIWPEKMNFHGNGEIESKLLARVIDPGLQEFLGGVKELYLNMNTHWHGISKIKARDGVEAVREYMRGTRQGSFEEEPLLVSFPYDEGFVIFTTFHNSHQVNALEHRLLQYLVLRPIMAKQANESDTIIKRKAFRPTKELLGALSVGEQSPLYEFNVVRPVDLKFVFNWQGKAVARVMIYDPQGTVVYEQNVRKQPFEMDQQNARPGIWKFRLKIVDAPMANFPFVINVGVKDLVEQRLANPSFSQDSLPPDVIPAMSNAQSQAPSNLMMFSTDRSVTYEILEPLRRTVGKFDLGLGQPMAFGKREIPADIPGQADVDEKQLILQLNEPNVLLVKNIGQCPVAAMTYKGGGYNPKPLPPNISVEFQFPLIIKFGDNILIGLY